MQPKQKSQTRHTHTRRLIETCTGIHTKNKPSHSPTHTDTDTGTHIHTQTHTHTHTEIYKYRKSN